MKKYCNVIYINTFDTTYIIHKAQPTAYSSPRVWIVWPYDPSCVYKRIMIMPTTVTANPAYLFQMYMKINGTDAK